MRAAVEWDPNFQLDADPSAAGDQRVNRAVSMPVSWILPPDVPAVRLPTRPARYRQDGFDTAFDSSTLFYDCFKTSDERHVVLLGPPLLNLSAAMTEVSARSQPAETPCRIKIRTLDRHSQLWIDVPKNTTAVTLNGPLGHRILVPARDESDIFAGKRVLLTLSRDNRIPWILDWTRFHRDVHGADAVLLYDNGSTQYRPDDLARALLSLDRIDAVQVVHWPFKYGPQSFHGKYWDSDFCQSGALEDARWRYLQKARSVLNCDIDELVVSAREESVFATAEQSNRGYVRFDGHWIVPLAAASEDVITPHDPRHRDYQVALTVKREWHRFRPLQTNRCAPKWAAVPSRIPAGAQWKTHAITGMQWWPASDRQMTYRHFRGINTSWKYQRTLGEAFHVSRHAIDEELMRAYERVRWDS